MITVERLTKKYGQNTAVDDLSFYVEDGSLFAFLGTNGAAKSTTISCMTTLLEFESGRIAVDGKEVGRRDSEIRADIGIVFQQSLLDPRLTVRENLESRALFYSVSSSHVNELIELIEMGDFQGRPYGVLSGGEKRRVDIARALLNKPSMLFLDEPTTGLDPQSREQVWSVISQLRTGRGLTVLLTTHYMAETENADRVLVIDHGHSVAEGTPFELRARYSTPHLSISIDHDDQSLSVVDRVHALVPGVRVKMQEVGGAVHLAVPDSTAALRVLDAVRPHLADFEFRQGSMDDVFLALTAQKEEA
jgi:putative multidrug ABC transporter ATP-binding protein